MVSFVKIIFSFFAIGSSQLMEDGHHDHDHFDSIIQHIIMNPQSRHIDAVFRRGI